MVTRCDKITKFNAKDSIGLQLFPWGALLPIFRSTRPASVPPLAVSLLLAVITSPTSADGQSLLAI